MVWLAQRIIPTLAAIDHNEDYTNFTVTTTTKPGETAISDSMSVLIFATCGQTYGIVSGDIPENIHVDFVNADSGELVTSWDSENHGRITKKKNAPTTAIIGAF